MGIQDRLDKIEVYYRDRHVGTIAPYQRYLTAFEYSKEWIRDGFSISPFSLPLEPGVKIAKSDPFDGMFGVFFDSLPDGWGRLLVDRMLRKEGINPQEMGPLSRLCLVGQNGRGALEYKPVYQWNASQETRSDLDHLEAECRKILRSEESDDLDILFALGGSSGGARPKVLLELDDSEWIVKFPSSNDPVEIGLMEYNYHLCAQACGIEIPEIRLLPSRRCQGYFASRRFDRANDAGNQKIHMLSASALLEVSHRVPALDYTSLMALTWQLTKRTEEVRKMFLRMCFNIYAHNRDDHSNNFSFLYDHDRWRLSPAYDLTWSTSIGGEHATTVAGEGRDPGMKNILQVAKIAGISELQARESAERVREIVNERLGEYLRAK